MQVLAGFMVSKTKINVLQNETIFKQTNPCKFPDQVGGYSKQKLKIEMVRNKSIKVREISHFIFVQRNRKEVSKKIPKKIEMNCKIYD
jgi:hypothetical protein